MRRLLRAGGFSVFNVRASAARSIGMVRESLALASTRSGWRRQASAARHVLAARWRFQWDRDSGDELVVEASRA